jgi:ribonuclease BN (tRNA processing enzyme)
MVMRCDVLGATGSRPGRGMACSGYLVTTDATRVLVDCGFGVATALTGRMDPADLDAIVVTHRHLDHCIDLLGVYAALRRTASSVPVLAAPEVEETVGRIITDNRLEEWRSRLPMTLFDAGDVVTVGDLTIAAHASDHPVPTVSLRLTDATGAVLAYSSDSGGGADLMACAAGADVLLAEASWQVDDQDRLGDGHMTALQAAEVARDAGAAWLVLTHLRPHLDPARSAAEAATAFGGPITVATDGMVFTVGDDTAGGPAGTTTGATTVTTEATAPAGGGRAAATPAGAPIGGAPARADRPVVSSTSDGPGGRSAG